MLVYLCIAQLPKQAIIEGKDVNEIMAQINQRAAIAVNFRCPADLYDQMERVGVEFFPTPGKALEFNQGKTLKLLIKAGIEAINSSDPNSDRFDGIEERLDRLENLLIGDGK